MSLSWEEFGELEIEGLLRFARIGGCRKSLILESSPMSRVLPWMLGSVT